MKMTIREVISKLSDIERAIQDVDKLMQSETTGYFDADPKDRVMELIGEYANTIKDTKVDI
jgi:hypothetical protein